MARKAQVAVEPRRDGYGTDPRRVKGQVCTEGSWEGGRDSGYGRGKIPGVAQVRTRELVSWTARRLLAWVPTGFAARFSG